MKRAILLLILTQALLLAGWFSTSREKTIPLNNESLFVFKDSDKGSDYRAFSYNKVYFVNNKNYRDDISRDMKAVFMEVEKFGKDNGYKSYVLLNSSVNYFEGFPFNDTHDLINYCLVFSEDANERPRSVCSLGDDPFMGKTSGEIRLKVLYFKENNPNFFPIR